MIAARCRSSVLDRVEATQADGMTHELSTLQVPLRYK